MCEAAVRLIHQAASLHPQVSFIIGAVSDLIAAPGMGSLAARGAFLNFQTRYSDHLSSYANELMSGPLFVWPHYADSFMCSAGDECNKHWCGRPVCSLTSPLVCSAQLIGLSKCALLIVLLLLLNFHFFNDIVVFLSHCSQHLPAPDPLYVQFVRKVLYN